MCINRRYLLKECQAFSRLLGQNLRFIKSLELSTNSLPHVLNPFNPHIWPTTRLKTLSWLTAWSAVRLSGPISWPVYLRNVEVITFYSKDENCDGKLDIVYEILGFLVRHFPLLSEVRIVCLCDAAHTVRYAVQEQALLDWDTQAKMVSLDEYCHPRPAEKEAMKAVRHIC
jgi:hypothetical protein